MNTFEVCLASQLTSQRPEHRWLIEALWGADAVGTVGGEPKSYKSFLVLQMAVAVASGTPCLGRFPVHRSGPVLLFAAEDALHMVRARLEGICGHLGVTLEGLPLYVITAPRIRLDQPEDCDKLANTVEGVKPALLVLDPFVRLHQADENVAAAIVPLLAVLREIQRRFGCALVVVHHAKKGAGNLRAGQALRGSSEFHAWSDASLFLRRRGALVLLSAEHRAHPSPSPMTLRLAVEGQQVALVITKGPGDSQDSETSPPPGERSTPKKVLETLANLQRPASVQKLQKHCRMRTQTLCAALTELERAQLAIRSSRGWLLPSDVSTSTATTTGLRSVERGQVERASSDCQHSDPPQPSFPLSS